MEILTDGRQCVRPSLIVNGKTEEKAVYRLSLPAGRRADSRWWGSFEQGDRIALRVEGSSLPPRLDALDGDGHPLAARRLGNRVEYEVERTGPVHLVIRRSPRVRVPRVICRRSRPGSSIAARRGPARFLSALPSLPGSRSREGAA